MNCLQDEMNKQRMRSLKKNELITWMQRELEESHEKVCVGVYVCGHNVDM